jgi:hypothetical protein
VVVDKEIKPKVVMESSTNYCINDYRINELPDVNPLQQVIEDFVQRRNAYINQRSSSNVSGASFKSSQSQ